MSEQNNNEGRPKPELHSIPLLQPSSDPGAAMITPPAPQQPRNTAGEHLLAASGRRSATPPAPPARTAPAAPAATADASADAGPVDWNLVAFLRSSVSDDLTSATRAKGGTLSDQDERELARTHINEAIRDHVTQAVRSGGDQSAWSDVRRAAVAKAVFDSLFGLGRIQPLLEEDGIENLHIIGHDKVFAFYADGSIERKEPIANSDEEFIADLLFIATHINGTQNARPFDAANPQLDLDLRGSARLTATYPGIEPRPSAVIRVHRFVDVTLEDMAVVRRTLTQPAVLFLEAAVRASRRLVIAGPPGAGKTTLMRALCNEIDPFEPIVTIEKEYELYLDRMENRHPICYAMQWRKGQGEVRSDGTVAGAIGLDKLFEQALRKDVRRVIVGEARGEEVDPMFQAFQAGVGGMTTIHAESAQETISRLSLLAQMRLGLPTTTATELIEQNIDIVVHMTRVAENGRWRRVLTEIAEVQKSEGRTPTRAVPLFKMNPATHNLERTNNNPTPELLEQLLAFGLDPLKSLQIEGEAA